VYRASQSLHHECARDENVVHVNGWCPSRDSGPVAPHFLANYFQLHCAIPSQEPALLQRKGPHPQSSRSLCSGTDSSEAFFDLVHGRIWLRSKRALADMIIPGVQKPHWKPNSHKIALKRMQVSVLREPFNSRDLSSLNGQGIGNAGAPQFSIHKYTNMLRSHRFHNPFWGS